MQVVILCGGKGTRLREETEFKPKPMVEIGGKPILWHIMKTYAHFGLTDFILCLGYRGDVIKQFFLNYEWLHSNFTIELGSQRRQLLDQHPETNWRVTLVDTGLESMTGARVKRIEPYIEGETFMLTYGDGVSNLNLDDLLNFHHAHGKIGTVTGVSPPSRYGELGIEGDQVLSFREKPQVQQAFISGGYFVFNRLVFEYLTPEGSCVLEREPLEQLTSQGQMKVYHHRGFWQCMDTLRDYEYLKELWQQGQAPWSVWDA
ncbi:glucose-1-phosphate cytidylyltransferase [Neosynechococcus sphagnicola sy1]|uniref:Glucose-1-phosphate cytidylyltransferase n=1 Tax=Neosynechococcus sphagnicola sy1 TaxID=1497020 RepID=A0A098TLN2_9CYAN|nr:glucose-1-phosphate cytidylyltransferase [Neosynechococcus sphagnicola]KGF73220.1 glucose-1-phosphate cytidylyltransferase [Neosynechococcus sphagnicola sy1]